MINLGKYRVSCFTAHMRRDDAAPQRFDDLDQSCKASCGFGMADIGFDRTNWKRAACPVAQRGECAHLDGIADRGAGPMRLNKVDIRRIDLRR